MQKYCIKKGKSSLVRDRELPFKSPFSSLKNLALFCSRKPQNCLLTIHYTMLFTTHPGGLQHNHLGASLRSTPGQPQIHIKCPDAGKHQQQQMDDQGLSHRSGKQTAPSYSYSSFPYHIHRRYLDRVFPSSWPKWTHQTNPVLVPDQAPALQLLLPSAEGPQQPILETPVPTAAFCAFFLNCRQAEVFCKPPTQPYASAACSSPLKNAVGHELLSSETLFQESWTSPHTAGCSLLLGCMRQLENPQFSCFWPAPLRYA